MIKHLLFDLDNTLYSAKYGLEKKVSERLERFISELLNISHEESEQTHRDLIQKKGYGTTLEWLLTEKGFTDIETYYAAINPEDEADSLSADPELGNFLASIPLPKAILSNSCRIHIDRILNKLGIAGNFEYIFDIRLNNYRGKPHRDAFLRAMEAMNARPETTLFIDDYPEYLAGFSKIGGQCLLLDESDRHAGLSFNRIRNLRELERFL